MSLLNDSNISVEKDTYDLDNKRWKEKTLLPLYIKEVQIEKVLTLKLNNLKASMEKKEDSAYFDIVSLKKSLDKLTLDDN